MIKIISSIAAAGLMGLTLTSPVQSQERTFRRLTAGEPAALQNAMTQSQARRACQSEMRGGRDSRSTTRQKMSICMNKKINGN